MPDQLLVDPIDQLKQNIASLEETQRTTGVDLFAQIQSLRAILSTLEQAAPSITTQSGGVTAQADTVTIGGDVTGRDKIESNTATNTGRGSVAQGDRAQAVGEGGIGVGGDVGGHVIIAETGATVIVGEPPVTMTAVDRETALGQYLQHVISRNRYLQLQGIRSGGKLVSIELDQIYVTLRATRERTVSNEDEWLQDEAELAPGEVQRLHAQRLGTETVVVSVNEALAAQTRLVVLGDPGSGKTTLLRYLALLYARDIAERVALVRDKLGLNESRRLPILLPLRQIGAFLRKQTDDGTDGHALLLDFLFKSLRNERLELPADFFDKTLQQGGAVILLDGLDEVADPDLRRRVARLVEDFTRAYPQCRYLVTSRIVGYTGAARLGENYATTTVRDFTLAGVERFLTHWHRLVAVGQMDPGESAEAFAADQTQQLSSAIKANERIRDLAINPLMLTVIAMVHRDRVKLPDRRAELYTEAVDVLLGKWEEAKGFQPDALILDNRAFDTGDRRVMLQQIALKMHERQLKEVAAEELRGWLTALFLEVTNDPRAADRAVERFLHVIEERTGLLTARGEGVYAFSHLTFQEYLAALAIATRDDYVAYTLSHVPNAWWREVVLLEAGYLSMQGKQRATALIQAIIDCAAEPEPYHNLVLAAECLRDVGQVRVTGDLYGEVQRRLRKEFETPLRKPVRETKRGKGEAPLDLPALIRRRAAATEALGRIESDGTGTQSAFWRLPHGEPVWVDVSAGEFMLGGDGQYDGKPVHRVNLPAFKIARAPITNAQYKLFVEAAQQPSPQHWEDGKVPRGLENHPVVYVSWHDAMAYCRWLSGATGKAITLPSEAQWEKAARGDLDQRAYPWGEEWDETKCNSRELGIGGTTPVGIFPEGASPYGCLDMAGNVCEWCHSIYKPYPYQANDGRESEAGSGSRVVRGGSWRNNQDDARCACHFNGDLDDCGDFAGFRCILSAGSCL